MRKFVFSMALLVSLGFFSRSAVLGQQSSIGNPTGSFCALLVPNARESARWYQEYLGFSMIRTSNGPKRASRTIMLDQNGVMLEIIEARDTFALQQVTRKKPSNLQGIRKFGLVVEKDAFDALYASLIQKKATLVGGVFVDDGLKMRSFIVQDNYGNLVQFFSRIRA